MAVSKLKELPVKTQDTIQDTDIMVVEDEYDTKQATIRDLKILFSSDKKIELLREYLDNTISELQKSTDTALSELTSKYNEVLSLYQNAQSAISTLSDRFTELQKHMNTIDDDVDDLQNTTSQHTKSIDTINTNISNIKTTLQNYKKLIDTNTNNITSIDKTVTANKNEYDSFVKAYNTTIEEIKHDIIRLDNDITNSNTSYSNSLKDTYDTIMKYIDYYHHIHTHPPNFDNPPSDPDNPATELPVGSVFVTVLKDFTPNGILSGMWEMAGTSIATVDNDELIQYIFIRKK